MSRPDAQGESLAIPDSVRKIVDARDLLHCRVCGKWLGDRRALHHVIYGGDARGMGGRRVHNPDEIVTVCWLPGDGGCHEVVHNAKLIWQPLLLAVAQRRGITAFQLKRQLARRGGERNATRPHPLMPTAHHFSGEPMICQPCRDQRHDVCEDLTHARELTSCSCQHKSPPAAEPATGPAGE